MYSVRGSCLDSNFGKNYNSDWLDWAFNNVKPNWLALIQLISFNPGKDEDVQGKGGEGVWMFRTPVSIVWTTLAKHLNVIIPIKMTTVHEVWSWSADVWTPVSIGWTTFAEDLAGQDIILRPPEPSSTL